MKYTIFALAVCLLCVNAVVVPSDSEDSLPELADLTDGQVAPVDFGVASLTYKTVKVTLRSVKGFNCAIKWCGGVGNSATTFQTDVTKCGVTASKDLTNLINANIQIYQQTANIVNFSTGVCASEQDAENPSISNSCLVKTAAAVYKLKKEVQAAVVLANKLPQTGPNASVCVNNAINTLTTYYTEFPQNIIACSKLVS